MKKLGQATIVAVIIGLVSAVIGFVIVDDVLTPATNEYSGTAQQITMATTGVTVCSGEIDIGSETLINATDSAQALVYSYHYNISDCTIIAASNWTGNAVNITGFNYRPPEYFNSSLSRTIGTYVVPIGLLGVLAMAAFLATK